MTDSSQSPQERAQFAQFARFCTALSGSAHAPTQRQNGGSVSVLPSLTSHSV
jgi:hypothetical protein